MLLSARNITKSYGFTTILRDASLSLDVRERVGIVGANGAGKTTLIRILAGDEQPDSGQITFAPGVETGYLPQTLPTTPGLTLDAVIREAVGDLRTLEERMRTLEAAMASASGGELASLLDAYAHVTTRFQERGGYELDHRLDEILAGLHLDYLPRERELSALSGGERARVGLAALLLRTPDILLLDEPTNHLDVATLEWLETYLSGYRGGVLAVSHDRQFLNRTVTRILEVDDLTPELRRYEDNYDAYAAAKSAAIAHWEASYARQQEEIRDLRKRLREAGGRVGHNRASTDNDKSAYKAAGQRVEATVSQRVRSAATELARIEAHPIEKPPKPLRFQVRFGAEALRSREIIRAQGISKQLGSRALLRDISFTISPEARVALVGENGAGKTTLLRLLLDLDTPDTGAVRLAPGARVGYLPQDPAIARSERSLLDVYREDVTGPEGTIVASILGNGLFRLEDLSKRTADLSVGQLRKLEIARLIARQPNILILDEPTNYISLDVLELFEQAVFAFPGPVLVATHDRWFLRRFGADLWELRDGRITLHPARSDGALAWMGSDAPRRAGA